jgi:hypothetical protein
MIFALDKKRCNSISEYRDLWARTRWMLEQVLPHVPENVKQRIQIEYEVNLTDPDFNFYEAVFGTEPRPLESLGTHLQKHSSSR